MSEPPRVRRVVLVVDAADRSELFAREAARVAAALQVGLEACFVEDEELLRWAGNAFAQRYGAAASARPVEVAELEREWSALRGEVRRAVEREATRLQVVTRFEVRRAPAPEAMDGSLDEGDVCLVAWGGWAPPAERRAPVRVLFDGSEAAGRAVSLAARLAGPSGRVTVMLLPSTVIDDLPTDVGELRVVALADLSPSTVRHQVASDPGGLLIVPSGAEIAARLAERSVAARFSASVLVVG